DPRPVGMGRRAHRSSICFLENPMIAKKQETAGVGVESDDRRAIRSVSIAVLLVCACSFRAFAQPTGMRVDTDPAGAGKSSSYFPKIAYDSSGFVHVVWQDFRDPDWAIYYRQGLNYAATWALSDVRLSPTGSSALDPEVAVDGANVYVVWRTLSPTAGASDERIWYATSNNHGAAGSWS